jgi:HAD superfamily hydrolase (TIGR01509 family)
MSDSAVAAVVFDLDGVLVDTEPVWDAAKREVTEQAGGRWRESAGAEMLGMSGPEWAEFMRVELGIPLPSDEIWRRAVDGVLRRLDAHVPLIPGARQAVEAVAARWPIAVASSADRPVIEKVLDAAGIASLFGATVSSAEAGRGKPAPDVYLMAARRLGMPPDKAVAIEDAGNGMRSAVAAGMALIAIPNTSTPVDPDAVALADLVLESIEQLGPEAIERAAARRSVRGRQAP